MNNILLLLQTIDTTKKTGGVLQVGLLVLMVLVMYLLIIRPQQKRQKEVRKMLAQIKKGDQVVTVGGIRGQVEEVNDLSVILCIDSKIGTRVEFSKSSISEVLKESKNLKEIEPKSKQNDNNVEIKK